MSEQRTEKPGHSAGSRGTAWRRRLGPGYLGRLVDFNTGALRPGRLLVQEGDFGYAVMGSGSGAAEIRRWLETPGRNEGLDQAAASHPDIPDWVRDLDEPELRRLATAEALAGPELRRYNHNHLPAGSPDSTGGQFTFRDAASAFMPPSISVPDYRANIFKSPAQVQAWNDFIAAAKALPGATPSLTYVMAMTFAAEGGMKWAINSTHPANSVIAGLKPHDISGAVAAVGEFGEPLYPDLANLRDGWAPTAAQVAEIYHYVADRDLDTVGGYKALDRIGNAQAAAALFDTFFWSGAAGGASRVQQAINLVAGPNTVPVDSKMGPKTLAAYARLAKDPTTRRQLLDALAIVREHRVPPGQNDKARIEFFRFFNDK